MFLANHFPKTLKEIEITYDNICESTLKRLKRFYDGPNNFGDIVYTLDDIEYQISKVMNIYGVYQLVHPDKDIKEKSVELSNKLSEFVNENISSNKKIYQKFCVISNLVGCNKEEMYHYEEEIKAMKLNGLHLNKETRAKLLDYKNKVSILSTKMQDNSQKAESKAELVFTKSELKGVPKDLLGKLEKEKGEKGEKGEKTKVRYVVKTDHPTYNVIMSKCDVEETRKKVDELNKKVGAPENYEILNEIFRLRHQMANLVGYEDYAEMAYTNAMPRGKKNLDDFYSKLMPTIKDKAKQEIQTLKEYFGIDGDILSYNYRYYKSKYQQKEFGIDDEQVKRYFSTEQTISNIFSVYEMFLGIKLNSVKESVLHKNNIKLWDDNLRVIELYYEDELKGYIICDLFPRDGKYSHACCCDVLNNNATTKEDKAGVAVLVMNCFADYMTHSDVETFLHEFGHAIHQILGTSRFKQRGGFNTELDFVECPSQLLEEWAWESEILRLLSNGTIPEELIEKILLNRFSFIGYDTLRQIYLGQLSYQYHTKEYKSLVEDEKIVSDTVMKGVGLEFPDYSVNFVCNFGHLADYSACYYSYLWSQVYAVDIFCEIKKKDALLDCAVGKAYIDCIIGKGGSIKPIDMVTNFLGRDVDYTKFANYCMGKLS